jgi:hypothetical protein
MTDPTPRLNIIPPTPPLVNRNIPVSPRDNSPSPRAAAQIPYIRSVVEEWRTGKRDIDEAVCELSASMPNGRSFAKNIYTAFREEIKMSDDNDIMRRSKQALYAASIFSKRADQEDNFRYVDDMFIFFEKESRLNKG